MFAIAIRNASVNTSRGTAPPCIGMYSSSTKCVNRSSVVTSRVGVNAMLPTKNEGRLWGFDCPKSPYLLAGRAFATIASDIAPCCDVCM